MPLTHRGLYLLLTCVLLLGSHCKSVSEPEEIGSATDLATVIQNADRRGETVELPAGVYAVGGEKNRKVAVRADDLVVRGADRANTIVRRRPQSLGTTGKRDFYYGLFFEPAGPTERELAAAEWKFHAGTDGQPLHYTVIERGSLTLENLTLDCNMGEQGIERGDKVEHSAMLGFAGRKLVLNDGPYAGRTVFVAFREVRLENITIANEGYSDAIWITRGYFQPNIGAVRLANITTANRVNKKRGSIVFSSPVREIEITDCNVHRIELEESNAAHWYEAPRMTDEPVTASWKIRDTECAIFDIAAKGPSTYIDAERLTTTKNTLLYQIAGHFRNCDFVKTGDPRLNRLRDVEFEEVAWTFVPNERGVVQGIKLVGQYGEPFRASFLKNSFRATGKFSSGVLISSEYSAPEEQRIDVVFDDCTFDPRFGVLANTAMVKAKEKGNWEFRGLQPREKALIQRIGKANVRVKVE